MMKEWFRQWHKPLFVSFFFTFVFLLYLSHLLSQTRSLSDTFIDVAIFTLFTLIITILSAMGYLIYYFWKSDGPIEIKDVQDTLFDVLEKPQKKRVVTEDPQILRKEESVLIKQIQDQKYRGFKFLEGLSQDDLLKYMQVQHPQIIAIVMLMIDQEKSIKLLQELEQTLADEVSNIVEGKVNLLPSQVEKLDLALQEELLELYLECRILKKLEDSEIRQLLREVNKKELIFALKGARQELQERFLVNMSPKASAWFHNVLTHAPEVSQENSDNAIKKLSLLAKQLRDNGKIRATN